MVDQCCSVYQERSVTDLKYVFAVWWRIVLGCFVKCMSGNGWGGTSLPPPSLFPLIFPSAVSPPLRCQHACAAQMILYHCSNKARQRKWHFFESAVRCKMASVSVRIWRLYSQWDKHVPKIGSLPSEILSLSYGGHFVSASGQHYRMHVCFCATGYVCDQGTCCKITGK